MYNWKDHRLGKYIIVSRIGSGGMASVFKAVDDRTRKEVAIKVLPPWLDEEEENFQPRFEREAAILMRLHHPHIVPILDFGVEEGIYYIVMPLMEIGTLRERIRKGPLKPEEGAHIIRQVAEALQYAHDAGMVHRDVKPANILLDSKGNAWLSDFGTAHISDATASLTGSNVIGTPQYMAPEQARGESVSEKTDVYALGIVLYQMCTGQLPFDADTPLAIALKHASEPLPPPTAINPNIPQEISKVLVRALEKNPEDRYASALDLSKAFDNALKEVYDSKEGALKPGVRRPYAATQEYKPEEDVSEDKTVIDASPKKRRLAPIMLLGALILLPSLWLINRSFNSGPAEAGIATPTSSPTVDWKATVDSLSTAVAFAAGSNMSEEQIETAIAATLQALLVEASGTSNPVLPPTLDGSPEATTAPTETAIASSATVRTPTPSPTSTSTTAGTTAPPTASFTPSPSATHTSTYTASPTATLTRTPTRTATPTPDICALIDIGNFSTVSNNARWRITNGTGSTIMIEVLDLDWPRLNNTLFYIIVDGTVVWTGEEMDPPSHIDAWDNDAAARDVGLSAMLEASFGMNAASSGYDLSIKFDNGCQISQAN